MAIKAVLFDYGGVLTTAGRHGSIASVATQLYGLDLGWEKLDDLHDHLRRGLISTQDFFDELSRRHNSPKKLSRKDWEGASRDVFEKSIPVYELAQKLRENGIKTGILSNIYEMTATMLRAAGNYDDFEPLILSYELKMAKPDPEIFQLAIDRLNMGSNEIIFVDDQEKNIQTAKDLGMHTILATSTNQIIREVRRVVRKENGLAL